MLGLLSALVLLASCRPIHEEPMADRITEILTAKPSSVTGDLGDFTEAMGRVAIGRQTFGQALNAMRAEHLKQQKGEMDLDLAPREMELAEKEFDFKQKKFRFDSGSDDQKAYESAFKEMTGNLSGQDAARLHFYAKKHPENVTRANAYDVLSEGMLELGLKKPETEKKPDLAERKKATLMGQGYDEDTASGLAYGFITTGTDPVTGQMFLVDKRDGSRKAIIEKDGATGPASPLPKKVQISLGEQNTMIDRLLLQLPDAEQAIGPHSVGVGGRLGEFATETLGQIPGEIGEALTFEQTVNDRQRIRLLREDLIKALAKNSRVPLAEQERIIQLLPGDGLWENPQTALSNLRIVGEFLAKIRKENGVSLGEVPFEGTLEAPAKPASQEEYEALPSGSYFINPSTGTVRRKP